MRAAGRPVPLYRKPPYSFYRKGGYSCLVRALLYRTYRPGVVSLFTSTVVLRGVLQHLPEKNFAE